MTFLKCTRVATRTTIQTACLVLSLVSISLPAFSQLNLGHIYGAVTDPTGASVPGADGDRDGRGTRSCA